MAAMGKAVLRDKGITDTTDMRLGFHQPPYTSVDHLHLHVLAPTSQISKCLEYKFIPRSNRFVTEDCLRKHLKDNFSPEKTTQYCFCEPATPKLEPLNQSSY